MSKLLDVHEVIRLLSEVSNGASYCHVVHVMSILE